MRETASFEDDGLSGESTLCGEGKEDVGRINDNDPLKPGSSKYPWDWNKLPSDLTPESRRRKKNEIMPIQPGSAGPASGSIRKNKNSFSAGCPNKKEVLRIVSRGTRGRCVLHSRCVSFAFRLTNLLPKNRS